jgi:YHS domain-containing protein
VIRFILLAVLLLLVARAFWKVVDSVMEAAGAPRSARGGRTQNPSVRLVRDPVCGTHVPAASSLSLTKGGTTHYFCSEQCRAAFSKRGV